VSLAVSQKVFRECQYSTPPRASAMNTATAATEARLQDGHEGTKTIATIAVELGSAESAMLRAARASFPHYGPARGAPKYLWEPWAVARHLTAANFREPDFWPASA